MARRREDIRPFLGTGPIRTVPYTKTYSSGTTRTVPELTELCLSFHPQTPRLPYPYPVAQTIQKVIPCL
ncbi:hypothetical protein SeLEV6574_g06745 [Synchytrium endobioticum]|uniref:Uncharacterized protein n=1 Tax=Synchytrium endobioticum TaxID=286115 RepID=A0A507CMU2_9FUNG|nr:hypothetical protein SeLEV6574_g06745 [Synchytrium endobioticum]